MMNKMKQNDLLHLLGYVTKLALLDFNGGFFFQKHRFIIHMHCRCDKICCERTTKQKKGAQITHISFFSTLTKL